MAMDPYQLPTGVPEKSVVLTPTGKSPQDVFTISVEGHMGLWLEPGEFYRKLSQSDINWLSDLMGVSSDDIVKRKVWPMSSRYYDENTMNANFLLKLLRHDCIFYQPGKQVAWTLDYLNFGSNGWSFNRSVPEALDMGRSFTKMATNENLSTIFMRFERLYDPMCTKALLSVDARTWSSLLSRMDVLPSFLELLHSNTGGCISHLSVDRLASPSPESHTRTFHFGIKFGNWAWQEGAVYVRHELNTGKQFALFAGTNAYGTSESFFESFQNCAKLSIPEIVLWFTHRRLILVEQQRWAADSMTQALENRTGFYDCTKSVRPFVRLQELSYTQDQVIADDRLSSIARASQETLNVLETLAVQFARYVKILDEAGDRTITAQRWAAIEDALQLQTQLARTQATQISGLNTRLRQQKDAIKTLTLQRDTQVNIEIATSAKRDSELMRGITVVTMMFLPATCIATIFSMSSFHSDQEHSLSMQVDPSIWLYIAITVPLTAILLFWYSVWSRRFARDHVHLQEDPEAQNSARESAVRPFDLSRKCDSDLSAKLSANL